MPQAIADLVGKFICFALTLGSENVKNGSDIFLVSQVWSGDNILQIESNSEPITHASSASSIMSGGEVYLKYICKSYIVYYRKTFICLIIVLIFTIIFNVFLSWDKVSLTEKSEANSSEGSSTPFSKRKEKDQVDQISTSKKLCTKVVKMEKIKDDELNV